jgi:hypothetical protein
VRTILRASSIPRGVALDEHLALHVAGALDPGTCAQWVAGVVRLREAWTADFGGEQFALGRAFYTHFETGRSEEYFRDAAASDARVEDGAPGLQARMRELVAELTGARVVQRRGWCGAGVHVFPAGEKVARSGGVIHFDVEGLSRNQLARRRPALSLVVMLQPPGSLRLWDVRYSGREAATDAELAAHTEVIEYGIGDLVVFDSYRLHQIQPFAGARDRISATIHAAEVDRNLWESWF